MPLAIKVVKGNVVPGTAAHDPVVPGLARDDIAASGRPGNITVTPGPLGHFREFHQLAEDALVEVGKGAWVEIWGFELWPSSHGTHHGDLRDPALAEKGEPCWRVRIVGPLDQETPQTYAQPPTLSLRRACKVKSEECLAPDHYALQTLQGSVRLAPAG